MSQGFDPQDDGFQDSQPRNSNTWVWVLLGIVLVAMFLWVIYSALMIPAIEAARAATKNMRNHNQFRMVTLAMHNYATENRRLPAAYTVNEDGQRLHSWRVALLPYLDEAELYKQIRLNEPWDSEWNKQFHNKCPKVFQNPLVDLAPDETTFAVVVGENTAFPESRRVALEDIDDGTSNTVMITERSPVCWMDPNSDIPFEEAIKGVNNSPNGIRSYYMDRFTASLCDGCVVGISDDIPNDLLRKLCDRQDGERVDIINYAH